MSLLAVGTVAFDDIQTPFGHAEMAIGGAATYITLAASYLTKDIRLVSVVGDDFPDETLKAMSSRGISLDGLQIKEGGPSSGLEPPTTTRQHPARQEPQFLPPPQCRLVHPGQCSWDRME
ncbi:MAG: hypothetical protein AAF242_20750, partial [Bacteroidota bacterium]